MPGSLVGVTDPTLEEPSTMSPMLAAPLFLCSLAVTLAAARLFARRLDRLGVRFGLPEAVIGLLTALAADGPEIASALVALAKGAHTVSVGVLVGSNVFNLAAMIALSAVLAGSVRITRDALVLEGAVAGLATLVAAALLLGWLAPVIALVLLACLVVPYLLLLILGAPPASRMPFGGRFADGLARVVAHGGHPARRSRDDAGMTHHLLGLALLDVALIVAGSTGMVEAALALGARWGISSAVLGVLVLAPLTSLPNALTAVRLGIAHRGAALVSEAFNSNTINLLAGVTVPALFVGVTSATGLAAANIAWLIAMTGACLLLLSRPRGMGRCGGGIVILGYLAFVVLQLITTNGAGPSRP